MSKCQFPGCKFGSIPESIYCFNHDRVYGEARIKLPGVNDKRAEQEKEYSKLRVIFLKENPVCMFPGCKNKATQVHHAKGKIGKMLIVVKWFRGLCGDHHRWVEVNPKAAKAMDLSESRLKKE